MAASMEVAVRVGQFDGLLLRWSLRAWLCSRAEEWRRFDELFDAYFFVPNRHTLVETPAGGTGRIAIGREGAARDDSEGAPLSLVGHDADAAHADGKRPSTARAAKRR